MQRIKNRYFLLIVSLLCFTGIPIIAQSCYELVWSDEFNYTGTPDTTHWTFETGNGSNGWGNNELEYYTSRLENARVDDSVLIIEARKENYNGSEYTSARMITYDNDLNLKYGKVEARIKLPEGQGIWPAFWMLGKNYFEGTGWPSCGEIDIMEMIGGGEGKDDTVYGTAHWSDSSGTYASYGGSYQLDDGIFADTFHVFSIEWNENEIVWYVDGNQYNVIDITTDGLSEFQEEFFILLNVAVGGDWPGSPNSSTEFSQKMYIDYVRVYQMNETPEIAGPSEVIKAQKNVSFSLPESEDFVYKWSVPDGAEIVEGEGTHSVKVNWGCIGDTIKCNLTTNCNSYELSRYVAITDLQISGENFILKNDTNLTYSILLSADASYTWSFPDGVTIKTNTDTNWVTVDWGAYSGNIKVNVINNCGKDSSVFHVKTIRQLPYPDSTNSHTLPGTILAVNYDYGGEGISYHDSDTENEGGGIRSDEGVDTESNDSSYHIAYIADDEWIEYTINVEESGTFDFIAYVASTGTSGKFKVLFNGEDRTGDISVSSTGGWTNFESVKVNNIPLYVTDTIMRVYMSGTDFNIYSFKIADTISSSPGTATALSENDFTEGKIFPSIVNRNLFVNNNCDNTTYMIININGEIVLKGIIESDNYIDVSSLNDGIYFLYFNEMNWGSKFIKSAR